MNHAEDKRGNEEGRSEIVLVLLLLLVLDHWRRIAIGRQPQLQISLAERSDKPGSVRVGSGAWFGLFTSARFCNEGPIEDRPLTDRP